MEIILRFLVLVSFGGILAALIEFDSWIVNLSIVFTLALYFMERSTKGAQ